MLQSINCWDQVQWQVFNGLSSNDKRKIGNYNLTVKGNRRLTLASEKCACGLSTAKPTIPLFALYTCVTRHLPTSGSLNITLWLKPLCIFSFWAFNLEQLISHHSSLFFLPWCSSSSLLLPFSNNLLLSFQGSTLLYFLPKVFLIPCYPQSMWGAASLHSHQPYGIMALNTVCEKLYCDCSFH